jgi:hypothetical protein
LYGKKLHHLRSIKKGFLLNIFKNKNRKIILKETTNTHLFLKHISSEIGQKKKIGIEVGLETATRVNLASLQIIEQFKKKTLWAFTILKIQDFSISSCRTILRYGNQLSVATIKYK